MQAETGKTVESAIEEKKKELNEVTKTLETLTGKRQPGVANKGEEDYITSQQQKITKMEARQASEFARLNKDIEYQVEQARINALDDSYEKTMRQRELNNKKELDDIERQKQDYIQKVIQTQKEIFDAQEELKAKQNPNYKKRSFNTSSVSVDTSSFDTMLASVKTRQSKETADALKQSMNEYLSIYGDYTEKRNAIIAKGETAKAGNNEWEQKIIDKETEKQLSTLDEQANKTTSAITALFGDMKDKTLADLQLISKRGKEALEFLKGGQWNAETGKSLGITEANFNVWKDDPEKIQAISNGLEQIDDNANQLRTSYDKVTEGVKKFFAAGSDPKKLTEALQDIDTGLNQIMQTSSFLKDTFSQLGDAFGSDTLNGIAEGIGVAMDAMNSAMQGAQAGAIFGQIGAAAGAAIGLVTSLASSIAKLHDAKNEKRIQDLQDQIDVLGSSYDKLGKSIEDAYSKDASNLIDQQNKLLEQQKILIQQQIREEQDKKKTDDDRIKEWQQQLEDIDALIADNKEAAIDAIFGEDLKSAIDNFSSAYAEAWTNGENRAESAKEVVKNMMQQMVTESIKSATQASGAMEKIRQKLQEFYADNVFSSWEQEYIYNMAEELQKELDNQFGWAEDLYKDKTKEQQSASGRGFGTEMTHEDAGELSGRFTAVYESNLRIENATQQQTVAITELHGSMSALTAQASGLYNIADETRTILANSYLELQQIRENTGEIIKPIKQIQADMAEVKRNTSRL